MTDELTELTAISPIDGRYRSKTKSLAEFFSEYGLIRYRLIAEIRYFEFLLTDVLHKKLSTADRRKLQSIIDGFTITEAGEIKDIERKIRHDVKSIEHYLRQKYTEFSIPYAEFIHFGLTSEDTSSLAYGLILKELRSAILLPVLDTVITTLTDLAEKNAGVAMLARTHGQPAVGTTMGKELIVCVKRIHTERKHLEKILIEAKVSGAVGNYNAVCVAYPEVSWFTYFGDFIKQLGLVPNFVTTQIIPADSYIRIFQSVSLINTILIGFVQDMWRYISDGAIVQKPVAGEVGSSTMPQKVNPIDFENAEGNFGLANALFTFFAAKLPISRLQRDLSDSTVKRSMGTAFAYSMIGYQSVLAGLSKISVNEKLLTAELLSHPEVITEGIQTILRSTGDADAYEKLKNLSRGKTITADDISEFIRTLPVSLSVKKRLASITSVSYTGLSEKIVRTTIRDIRKK